MPVWRCPGLRRTLHEAWDLSESSLLFFAFLLHIKHNFVEFMCIFTGSIRAWVSDLYARRGSTVELRATTPSSRKCISVLHVTNSIFLPKRDVFSELLRSPALRTKGQGWDYLLWEQAGAWKLASNLCICVRARVEARVCMCAREGWGQRGGGCRARDARIKERLVEIKALPWSLPARLQATRVTNPSLVTLQWPPRSRGPR